MRPQLNHLIVWSRDRDAAAAFLTEVLGMDEPTKYGHFTQVETGNGVTIDFADATEEPSGMHLAFQVTERESDEVYGPNVINRHDGGRGVYFSDPHTNVGWEIITRPDGSGPADEQHSSAR